MSSGSDTIEKKDGKSGGIGNFVRETRSEWDKTTFPSKDDVQSTTIVVIISVVFFGIFIWLVDVGWVLVLDLLSKGVSALMGM